MDEYTDATIERLAKAAFDSMKFDTHNTEWDAWQGPTNLDPEFKVRMHKMVRAVLAELDNEA